MARRDPRQSAQRCIGEVAAELCFTDRERLIKLFWEHVEIDADDSTPVLVFHGVGGVGKTALINHLNDCLRDEASHVPFAKACLERATTPSASCLQTLAKLRHDLGRDFNVQFPSYDLLWSVMMAWTGAEVPLVRISLSLAKTSPEQLK